MRHAYDVAAVRAAEGALMATLPDGTLMGRAADGLAHTCAALLGRLYGSRVVLLVGTGDNGGDALYAGARLARRGAGVDALLLGVRAHEGGLASLRQAGGRVLEVGDGDVPAEAYDRLDAADLVVDGLLGIGGRGGLRGASAALVGTLDGSATWTVAVDLPSGVDADTGEVTGVAVRADVTVTFGVLKPGLLVGPGREHAGVVEVVDIGVEPWVSGPAALTSLEASDIDTLWPFPGPDDDKYTRGVVGVVAGSPAYRGAAVLCVGGALRAGAGMVRFLGDPAVGETVHAHWPEAVAGEGRVQAYVVGPGLGTDDAAAARLHEVLTRAEPVLVDADALTLLAAHQDWVRDRSGLTVLTPHDREYERFGTPVGADRVAAARRLAADLGATVLLKGTATVVADPDGAAHVNPTGTGWLATAGSGDVLSGVTGALLAAGLGAMAPVVGAYVHGLAGRLASDGGPASALQVAEAVPAAVRALAHLG